MEIRSDFGRYLCRVAERKTSLEILVSTPFLDELNCASRLLKVFRPPTQ